MEKHLHFSIILKMESTTIFYRINGVWDMKLGAALQELKTLQSKLARLYVLRNETFNYLEKKTAQVDFAKVTEEIDQLVRIIRDLKVRVDKSNTTTQLDVEGKRMCIQELILLIGDLRGELQQLQLLKPKGPVYLGGQAVEYIPQRKQDEMAGLISQLEQRKADLDKILQAKNWGIDLVD